jgi:hypothetical protein
VRLVWSCLGVTFVMVILMIASCASVNVSGTYVPSSMPARPIVRVSMMFDEKFTREDRENIKIGMLKWVIASHGRIVYQVVPHNEYVALELLRSSIGGDVRCPDIIEINAITSDNEIVMDRDEQKIKGKTLGFAVYRPCNISSAWLVVDRLKTKQAMQWVAAHELGHAIGLDHVENFQAVMHKVYTVFSSYCITKWDVEELCDEIGCNINDTLYCIP